MQEIDFEGGGGDVAGGISIVQAFVSWAVTRTLDYALSGVVSFAAAGSAPDYSRTNEMGDMY